MTTNAASTFCIALQLPVGWFETPQDIVPAATRELLAPRAPSIRTDLDKEFIRRENLRLMTREWEVQIRLSKLSGLSTASISHRMSGRKIFDTKTAQRLCNALLLPNDWFDQPQPSIPPATQKLLQVNETFPVHTTGTTN